MASTALRRKPRGVFFQVNLETTGSVNSTAPASQIHIDAVLSLSTSRS